jgi:hypothetical protein
MVADPTKEIKAVVPAESKICGTEFKMNKFVISPDLGIKNVFVALQDVTTGKAMPKEDLHIDLKNCQFYPLTAVAYKGSHIVVKNSDPIFHNISLGLMLKDRRSTVYNLAPPNQNIEIKNRSGVLDCIISSAMPIHGCGPTSMLLEIHMWR